MRICLAGDLWSQVVRLAFSLRDVGFSGPIRFDALNEIPADCSRILKGLQVDTSVHLPHSWPYPFSASHPFRTVAISWRLWQLRDELRRFDEPVLWLDTDIIVRKPLDTMFAKAAAHDFSIVQRPRSSDIRTRVLSSVLAVSPTPTAMATSKQWLPLYAAVLRRETEYTDQVVLARSFANSAASIWSLPAEKYNDSLYREAACIWHSKHGKKKRPNQAAWDKECAAIDARIAGMSDGQ